MTHTALVLGNGRCALEVAAELLRSGIDILLATPDDADRVGPLLGDDGGRRMTSLQNAILTACSGTAGNFSVSLAVNGQAVHRRVGAILIAESDEPAPTFGLYGLQPGPGVVSLSQLSPWQETPGSPEAGGGEVLDGVRTAVLISGLAGESTPAVAGRVMETACRLQGQHGIQTFVLTGNLKVAAEGLEALFRQAKTAGTLFFKFNGRLPQFEQTAGGKAAITFEDPVMREACRLNPDLCVVDERVAPSPHLARLAEVLRLETGPDGFIQTDNVHRQTVFTLRKGVFAVGPSRCAQSAADHSLDARNAALAVHALLISGGESPLAKAEIDKGQCIRCLTCYRLCPYRAIEVASRVSVAREACEGCGICAAECPRGAIRIEGLSRDEIIACFRPAEVPAENDGPRVVAFCCSRSAAKAAREAACAGYGLPGCLTLVEVPCAGAVSLEHLLAAFQDGADGVLVLTCHTDNCHSEHGNEHARMRVAYLEEQLRLLGLDPRRLSTASLAANMGLEFADIVAGFVRGIGG